MDLIKMVTEQVGVDESQARQGAGMLFGKAKEQLDDGSFAKLKEYVPDVDSLMDEAPEAEAEDAAGGGGGLMGMLGGAASKMGLGGISGMADLAGGFSKIGVSADKIGPFVTTVLEFIESKGGPQARALVEKFIKP